MTVIIMKAVAICLLLSGCFLYIYEEASSYLSHEMAERDMLNSLMTYMNNSEKKGFRFVEKGVPRTEGIYMTLREPNGDKFSVKVRYVTLHNGRLAFVCYYIAGNNLTQCQAENFSARQLRTLTKHIK